MRFKDRQEAGQKLVPKLKKYKDKTDVVVLGLPRGGIVLSYEVAKSLNIPMDLVVPRKIGAPNNEEFAIGAIAEDGEAVFDEGTISLYGIGQDYIDKEVEKERKEARRRLKKYRGDRPPLDLKNKVALVIDDGIATGSTMLAAIKSVKAKGAKKIVVAVPTVARDSIKLIEAEVDEFIYLDAPLFFGSVGEFYETFGQTEDEEVVELMDKIKQM